MHPRPVSGPLPCPFCRSDAVLLIGGTCIYLYFRCSACSEVWTATSSPAPEEPVYVVAPMSSSIH